MCSNCEVYGHHSADCVARFRPVPIEMEEAIKIFGHEDSWPLQSSYYTAKGEQIMKINFGGKTIQEGLMDGGADVPLMHWEFFDELVSLGYKAQQTGLGIVGIGKADKPGLCIKIPCRHRMKPGYITFYRMKSKTFPHRFLINNKALIFWGYIDSDQKHEKNEVLYVHDKCIVEQDKFNEYEYDSDEPMIEVNLNTIYETEIEDVIEVELETEEQIKHEEFECFFNGKSLEEITKYKSSGEGTPEQPYILEDGTKLIDLNISPNDCYNHPSCEIDKSITI